MLLSLCTYQSLEMLAKFFKTFNSLVLAMFYARIVIGFDMHISIQKRKSIQIQFGIYATNFTWKFKSLLHSYVKKAKKILWRQL